VGMIYGGCTGLGRLKRFKKYVQALGDRTYCDFERLAGAVGRSVKFVKKDIRFMIQKGWFLEGQTDQKETCLITSTETYRQYTETQKALEQRNEEECRKRQQETEQQKQISPEVQEVLDTMQKDMLERARAHRDAHTYVATNYEEFKDTINNKPGFVKAMWCGNRECEDKIKEDVQATSRCMPFEQEHLSDVCVCCGKPAKKMVYWGRAY
jgi:vacuolar-type H+-ATPase subunit I/STV1